MRELEWADIEAAYDFCAHRTIEALQYAKGHELPSFLVSVVFDKDKPGEIVSTDPAPPFLVEVIGGVGGPEALRELIKTLLAIPRKLPSVIVQIEEGWSTEHHAKPGEALDPFDFLPPIEDPNRQEVLTLLVHTPGKTYMGTNPITGQGAARTATFTPLDLNTQKTVGGGMTMQGGDRPPTAH